MPFMMSILRLRLFVGISKERYVASPWTFVCHQARI
jgi:hypothetical protein